MDPSKPFGRRKPEETFNFVSEADKAEAEELGISGEVYYYFKPYVSSVLPTVKSVMLMRAALSFSSEIDEMVVVPELAANKDNKN